MLSTTLTFLPPTLPTFHSHPSPLLAILSSNYASEEKASNSLKTNDGSSFWKTGKFRYFSCPCSNSSASEAEPCSLSPFRYNLDAKSVSLWLQSCENVTEVGRLHAIIKRSLSHCAVYISNNLISSYLRFGKLDLARKVFDEMTKRNVVSWTAMINGYLNFGLYDEAVSLYRDFMKTGVRGNSKMFVCVLNLCTRIVNFELGRQIHACIVKGNWKNLIVDCAVVHFYAQCGDMSSAFVVFDGMEERDVVCWTAIITACSQRGYGYRALLMFSQMLNDGFLPNEYTVCGALKACGEEHASKTGRQLHGLLVKKIIKNDVFVGTALVDMYAKCGGIADSRQVFDGMKQKNTATWTSIIAGYAREGLGEEAINLFRLMKRQKIYASPLTIVSILMACGSIKALRTGREVHLQIIKADIMYNLHIGSTLVWFYCKCNDYQRAFDVLQEMPSKNVVSWTALISGCARLGHESEALELLKEMMEEGLEPNSFTYSSALKACAKSEAILHGKAIHSCANKTPSLYNVFVGSALIYMYAKCGFVLEAFQVFNNMPQRNLVSWKAMILGYARNGHCREALQLLYRMQAEGFEVDDYILSTVLTSCGDLESNRKTSSHCLQST